MTFTPEQLGQSKAALAEKLRELRRRVGLTEDRLAQRCNLSQSQISKIETGKRVPKLVDLERILTVLEAPPELVAEVTALARVSHTEWQDKAPSRAGALESQTRELRYFMPSIRTARRTLRVLFTDPVSAQIGLIEPRPVLQMLDQAVLGLRMPFGAFNRLLAIELWLRHLHNVPLTPEAVHA